MRDRDLYAAILGLSDPWMVVDVDLERDQQEVRVRVAAAPRARMNCPKCGRACPRHDHRRRSWRHLDTCQFRTILDADVPRVDCPEHGVRQVAVPWAEPGSRFTAMFEALVIDWLHEASTLAVARLMDLTWDETAGIQERAVRRGLARREAHAVEYIGVDETSFRKRHNYVTVVTDLITGEVLDVTNDRRERSLNEFFATLDADQLAAIHAIAMDMHQPYIASTRKHLPNADDLICFDRFHVAQHFGDAVDKVRRAEHRELSRSGDEVLTGTKYFWFS